MPDPRFFDAPKPVKLSVLPKHADLALSDQKDANFEISGVAPLDQARSSDLSFLDNVKYRATFRNTKAGACIIHPDYVSEAPAGVRLLVSEHPYKAYAQVAQFLYPSRQSKGYISDQAFVSPDAVIGEGCTIKAGACINKGAEIGAHSIISNNTVIEENVSIGEYCQIDANTTISHSVIGNHVRIYPGCCIGQDGFGFAMSDTGFVKVPQLGRVIIQDHVEIGASTTIDRGAGPDTVIGTGTWIDNLVQIGHNVKIGRNCVIVAQCGISGSVEVEDFVVLAGQVGVAGHLTIGKGARIGAQSGIMRDVPAGQEVMGSPAMPAKTFMKQVALLKKMVINKNNK